MICDLRPSMHQWPKKSSRIPNLAACMACIHSSTHSHAFPVVAATLARENHAIVHAAAASPSCIKLEGPRRQRNSFLNLSNFSLGTVPLISMVYYTDDSEQHESWIKVGVGVADSALYIYQVSD
jgi:hypothetical protein